MARPALRAERCNVPRTGKPAPKDDARSQRRRGARASRAPSASVGKASGGGVAEAADRRAPIEVVAGHCGAAGDLAGRTRLRPSGGRGRGSSSARRDARRRATSQRPSPRAARGALATRTIFVPLDVAAGYAPETGVARRGAPRRRSTVSASPGTTATPTAGLAVRRLRRQLDSAAAGQGRPLPRAVAFHIDHRTLGPPSSDINRL